MSRENSDLQWHPEIPTISTQEDIYLLAESNSDGEETTVLAILLLMNES